MTITRPAAVAFAATIFTTTAHAALVSISGGGQILDPAPLNFAMPDQEQASVVRGIDEQQNLVLGTDLEIADLEDLIGVVSFSAGDRVSSHLLKFDPASQQSVSNIVIEFDEDVLAVISNDGTLFDTHAVFGLPGLNYPDSEINLYGFEASEEDFSVRGNTVIFSGNASTPGDHFRVLTAVPAPAATAPLLALAFAARRRR